MKRIFLILFAVLLTGGMMLQAEPVSESRAREVAMKVLAAQPATKAAAADVKLIWDGEEAATKAAVNPAYYVFGSDRGGFVIIAGDDNVQPVLAISETSQFKVEGMPENVKWWMERMKFFVRNASSTTKVKQQWAIFAETKSGPVTDDLSQVLNRVEKLTPEWDQGNNDEVLFGSGVHVFNAHCPTVGSSLTLTGCVATALGEILTYQSGVYNASMPTSGTGSVGGYPAEAGFVVPASYALGITYDWVNLRTLSDRSAIKAVVDANTTEGNALLDNLGHLLADLGAIVKAQYSVSGTSARTLQAIIGLGTHLGYNKAAYYAEAADYTPRQWVQKLKDELDERPLVYDGQTGGGDGHAFIFDGYGTYGGNDVFHVNFGWAGACNGYYYYYDLDAGGGHDYSYNCGAIFDLYPEPLSSYKYSLQYTDKFYPGLQFVDPFDAENDFRIKLSIMNSGIIDYSGKIKAKLLDKNGTFKANFKIYSFSSGNFEDESDSFDVAGFAGRQYYILLTGSPTIAFGDKIVIYCTTDEGQTVFEPIKELTDGTVLNSLPVMPAAFIKVNPLGYSVNDYFQLQLANYDYAYDATEWTITNMSGGAPVVKQQSDWEYQFTQAGTYKIEAAVAPYGGAVVETIVTYVVVGD